MEATLQGCSSEGESPQAESMTRERFTELVQQEQEGLRKFLLVLCEGNQADADDLAQDTLLKAYLSYDGFVERFKFSTWLYRIAYNTFVDYCRRPPQAAEPLSEAEGIEGEEPTDGAYRYEPLYRALAGLPPNEKTALLLHYMENKSILEIALILKCAPGTVKSHLSRGRNHLKTKLEEA